MNIKLTSYIKENTKYFILSPILTALESLSELLLPLLMGQIVDSGVRQRDTKSILTLGVIMVIISSIGLLCGILSAKYSSRAAQGFGANIRTALFNKTQMFSFADIDRFSTASLVTRCTSDVKQIQDVTLQVIRMLVRAPTLLFISMIICMRINPQLSLVYLVAIPALLLLVVGIMKYTRPLFNMMQSKLDSVNAAVQENMIGIRVVKTFVRTAFEKQKFKKANDDLTNSSIRAGVLVSLMHPCSTAVFNLAAIALYWIGGKMVGNEQMLSGELLTFVSYLNNIMFSVMMFTMVLTRLSRAQVCMERCREVLNAPPSVNSGRILLGDALKGNITFEDVSFHYPIAHKKSLALHNITFDIKQGELVAIIGRTGCGKTSLVNLMSRFYDTTNGRILIDGVDIKEYDLKYLRSNVGVVLQNNRLFSGSIRENLLWGAPNAQTEDIMRAVRYAQAEEFIANFPDGLDTHIEQGGINVSGGQRQRLCIARALLNNPPILILDDSTSALDSTTEAKFRKTLKEQYKTSTVLLIAQKISSVQHADKIIVLENGEIHAIGTHEQLMREAPIYQAIYHSQQEEKTYV